MHNRDGNCVTEKMRVHCEKLSISLIELDQAIQFWMQWSKFENNKNVCK